MNRWTATLWTVALALVAFPLWYAFTHWGEATFRDSAIAGWVGTVAGVVVGVPVALQLSRWQEGAQNRARAAAAAREFSQEARVMRERLFEEFQFNLGAVDELVSILRRPGRARADTWNWAKSVAESLEFGARTDYEKVIAFRSTATRLEDGPAFSAYRDLKRLQHAVTQASCAHDYLLGYSADQSTADARLASIHAEAVNVKQALSQVQSKLKSWIR